VRTRLSDLRGGSVEIAHMPGFFDTHTDIETMRTHVHPFYEIVWFTRGEGVHTVDFTDYPVADNTIFFIAPGQLHSFDGSRSSEGHVVKICPHLLGGVLLKYNVFNTYDSVPYKRIAAGCAGSILGILSMIEDEVAKCDSVGHTDYLQSLVTMLLIKIERCNMVQNDAIFSTNRTAHRTFLAFRREIEHHFRSMHTVKEYAELLNVSTKTLTNYVAECSQHTPLEMINNRIVLEAKRLLRYSDMMVKEIAATLGFDDPSYFNKFFKRLVRCSAAESRTLE
ncbi:MAG: helix-turn-helix domain-containing protein, partial [Bacteroidaceae bacterium]|nr:helix-turn-helix domain-containing protein [Bacteroidaceae bacterium]